MYVVNTYLNVKFAFTAYSHILLKNVKIKAQIFVFGLISILPTVISGLGGIPSGK